MGSFVVPCRLLVAEHRLLSSCGAWAPEHTGSVVAACQLSCPGACGILVPDQGLNPHPLHWKEDSFFFFNEFIYLFIYLFIFGCIGSSLLHAGFL